jgi:aryl-alcohol dehydrogenase-like predicted oxidoreductase
MDQKVPERIHLGTSELMVSPLGVGTNTWGSLHKANPALRDTFEAALDLGINFFDTAEVYQLNGSELTLGQFLPAAKGRAQPGAGPIVETKIFPFPWRLSAKSLLPTLRASLDRLQLDCVDVYMIHFPLPPVSIEAWMDAFASAVEKGLVRAVGVSNYNAGQVKRAWAALEKRGVKLAVNQVEYNLLQRGPERNGLLSLCQSLGVTLIAYHPLASGLLTGKYASDDLPPVGRRSLEISRAAIIRVQPLVAVLRQIGETHGGKAPGQVATNWLMCKGALPIPGAKNLHQLQNNAGALGWRLSAGEVAILDTASGEIWWR